jgi:hypothetical protein
MARFVNAQVAEVVQPFWALLQRGEFHRGRRRGGGHVEVLGADAHRDKFVELEQPGGTQRAHVVGHDTERRRRCAALVELRRTHTGDVKR